MSKINQELGELLPLYEEYREIVNTAPEGNMSSPYNPLVALDKGRDFEEVPVVDYMLTRAGFATGSVRGLLEKCIEYEKDPEGEIDKADLALITSLKVVPENLRKSVRIMGDRYYYAGKFYSTRPEED